MDGQPQFYDALYFGTPVRWAPTSASWTASLSQGSQSQRVLVQVAETLESRQDFTRQMVLDAVARDVFLLLVALALVVMAVQGALRPLQRLRAEVAARSASDLTPVRTDQVPADVGPLVEAMNLHARRYLDAMGAAPQVCRRRLYQLVHATTATSTQMGFALRETDPIRKDAALAAMAQELDDAIRQTNQMLRWRVRGRCAWSPAPIDLYALAEATTRKPWPLARERLH